MWVVKYVNGAIVYLSVVKIHSNMSTYSLRLFKFNFSMKKKHVCVFSIYYMLEKYRAEEFFFNKLAAKWLPPRSAVDSIIVCLNWFQFLTQIFTRNPREWKKTLCLGSIALDPNIIIQRTRDCKITHALQQFKITQVHIKKHNPTNNIKKTSSNNVYIELYASFHAAP